MTNVVRYEERRGAERYRRMLRARASWLAGHEVRVSVGDFSVSGCFFTGTSVPDYGEQVQLTFGGLRPGGTLQITGRTVRYTADARVRGAAIAFLAPCEALLDFAQVGEATRAVLVVESDQHCRDAIVHTLTRMGIRAVGVGNAEDALRNSERLGFEAVLARSSDEGMRTFERLGQRARPPLRVTFGPDESVAVLLVRGIADVAVDNPCNVSALRTTFLHRSTR